ncbi:hypothetical protein [Arthrobacter sp. IK3]|uniref:hypothetical protein n=1 Tax=Arthrobacter sp. IK3 TaxID=3448169 RepID=UPI003EE15EC7
MHAWGSQILHSKSPGVEPKLRLQLEMEIMNVLRKASFGSRIDIDPILDHTDLLIACGDTESALGFLEAVADYPESLDAAGQGALDLALVKTRLRIQETSSAAILELNRIVGQDRLPLQLRHEALMLLGDVMASDGDYLRAARALDPRPDAEFADIYAIPATKVKRALFYNLAGEAEHASTDTRSFIRPDSGVNANDHWNGAIQHAWALTHAGDFRGSSANLRALSGSNATESDVLLYIQAWNEVGWRGVRFGDAMTEAFASDAPSDPGNDWLDGLFSAWRSYASGHVRDAAESFSELVNNRSEIEPALNASRRELALEGKAHAAYALGDYESAYESFGQLCTPLLRRPARTRFPVLMGAFYFGSLAARLNALAARGTISAARRCAQVSLGTNSTLVPKFMDVEAELLLADGHSAAARAVRTLALDLVSGASVAGEDTLSHRLGICLLDAYDDKTASALAGLEVLLPVLHKVLGRNHEKTVVARYSHASMKRANASSGTDIAEFEELHLDLARTLGKKSLLTLKARYGVGRDKQTSGDVTGALEIYKEVIRLLPDVPQNQSFRVSVNRRIGESYRTLQNYGAAIDAFSAAIRANESLISSLPERRLQIELDLNECLVLQGQYRKAMNFFAGKAAMLRADKRETSFEYFRAVRGYARCLESLGNHKGAAHNYGHLVRLLDEGMFDDALDLQLEIYFAAAWNNEQSRQFNAALANYLRTKTVLAEEPPTARHRRISIELDNRISCCQAGISTHTIAVS